jgi:glycosyltransferase involved in cell wall biosynthesis
VLYVGRIIERKGLHLLIEALRTVRERLRDVRLTVIGDGPKRAEYEALAMRDLGRDFEFLGSQPQAVVREYMQRASLLCMPSITMPSGEAESLGLVFLEAQAMSLPVVAFRSGGVPEVVVHGETGLLAEEGDTEDRSRDLLALLENAELRDRMGRAGRRHVESAFDLKSQNAKLEAVYEEVLAGAPPPETPASA